MAAVKRTIYFAFEQGERVWLRCDPSASGFVIRNVLELGYTPKYVVGFPNGHSTHTDWELTRDEPHPFLDAVDTQEDGE
jgi:hypothetical protein